MSRGKERSGGGLSIAGRFSLLMTLALLVVMAAAGFFLLDKSRKALGQATRHVLQETAGMTEAERIASRELQLAILREVNSKDQVDYDNALDRIIGNHRATFRENGQGTGAGRVRLFPVLIEEGPYADREALLLQYDGGANLLAPVDPYGGQGDSLFGLILMVSAGVIAVAAGVSMMVSTQVTRSIEVLVDDVRSIARGNLHHKTRVGSGGEVQHLARQIDRMAQTLEESQGAEIELGVRERERDVAKEVREALLPDAWPKVQGYALANLHVDSAEPGGDFHDFVAVDGKLILFVCEVSGRGVPGALVGATVRAYLKSELERGGDLETSLQKINRSVARDVRRGMYVTALVVVLDPAEHTVTVACAGHKLPLVRWDAAEKQVRLIQPGGIALGFDKGPLFDRGLELVRVALGPGDRLVLGTTGPVQVQNSDEEELGEKRFYKLVARNGTEAPEVMLDGILAAVEMFADGEEFPADLTLVALARS